MSKEEEIRRADTTDVYFLHTKGVLEAAGSDAEVIAEVFAREFPYEGSWGLLTGIYEVAKILQGLPIDVWSFDEASVFLTDRSSALYEPVMVIKGKYGEFARYENPILGLLSTATSISSYAARLRVAAKGKLLLSFGTRRAHPAISPLIERACYISGFDGVSNVLGAKLLGIEPSGTMPHSLVQLMGSQEKAWKAFDSYVTPNVRRVALVDTFWDEKAEAVAALEALGGKLWGVRLDTPPSRRGNFRKIIEEVRWELDARGGQNVKIIISGGLNDQSTAELAPYVDGFGVGSAVAHPPLVDFSMKVVEVIGANGSRRLTAKRGVLGGRKRVFRMDGFVDVVTLDSSGARLRGEPMLKPLLKKGKISAKFKSVERLRRRALAQIESVTSPSASPRLVRG